MPTQATIPRKEIEALIARLTALPAAAKFEVFEVLRADLASSLSEESEATRQTRERAEALQVIGEVAGHLGLEPDKAPTVQQFDRAAGELGLGWSSARVIRGWERWRLARDAYLGKRTPATPAQRRSRQRSSGGRRRTTEDYLAGLRGWLATTPKAETMAAYEEWVEACIAEGGEGVPPVRVNTLRRGLALPWPLIVAAARHELTPEEAADRELAARLPARSNEGLVGLAAIARLLGKSHSAASTVADSQGFPRSVARISGHRGWLISDIRLWRRGLAFPNRQEDELQQLFIDRPELEPRLCLNNRTLWRMIRAKRWDRVPQPEGAIVTGSYYWKRAKVEQWEVTRQSQKSQNPAAPRKRRAPRDRARGWRNHDASHYLAGVRLWLESSPTEESQASYKAFVEQHDGELDGVTLVKLVTLIKAFPLSWKDTLVAAKGDASLKQLAADELAKDQPARLEGALVAVAAAARILDVSVVTASSWTKRDDFPRPVACISDKPTWLVSDIRAFNRGRSFPDCAELELQQDYMEAEEILALLEFDGVNPMVALRRRIWKEQWEVVPEPEGVVAMGVYYWKRAKVESWRASRGCR